MSSLWEQMGNGIVNLVRSIAMSDTDYTNSINRGVVEYTPREVDYFFNPKKGLYSAIISGGDPYLRTSALLSQALCAVENGFPVIILHEGNRLLEEQIRRYFSGDSKFKEISQGKPCFDPFYGLSSLEITEQILETAPKKYDIKYNARYYIEGIEALLNASGKSLSFKRVTTCPHSRIFDIVDKKETNGQISSQLALEIKSKLMQGQSEVFKIDTFLASLNIEMGSLMYTPQGGNQPVSVISALESNSILCFDIASVTNKLLLNTVIYQLKLALTKGLQYQLIIDSIPTDSNESYAAYIKTPSDKICKTISTDDFYSMVGGDEKIFSSIVGNTQIFVIMGHSSANSARKWAEVFGQYDKFEESYSTMRGYTRRTPFSILPMPSYNKSVNVNRIREDVVKPEAITRMRKGEAYILSGALGQLCHVILRG